MKAVRIYLKFYKVRSKIRMDQLSQKLDGKIIIGRKVDIRKPYEKHMRIALMGAVETTKKQEKDITHIGIYTDNEMALSILEENISVRLEKRGIKVILNKQNTEIKGECCEQV